MPQQSTYFQGETSAHIVSYICLVYENKRQCISDTNDNIKFTKILNARASLDITGRYPLNDIV